MAPLPPPSLFTLLTLFSFLLTTTSSTTITIPLTPHHHNNPPPSSSPTDRLKHLASLSLSRAHHLKHPPSTTTTTPTPAVKTPVYSRSFGGYSINLSFGTPPQTTKFILDTGSSLVWFPCTSRYNCTSCDFPNVAKIPKFIPKLSSTAKPLKCEDPRCNLYYGSNTGCDAKKNQTACPPYGIRYGIGATAGLLLSETLDFKEKLVPDFLVGCSIFSVRQPEGIAGFGRTWDSLPSQMKLKKFSYCLVSRVFDETNVTSDLVLHLTSSKGGDGVTYTPFLKNPTNGNAAFRTYYYVSLRKIIVGGKTVRIPYKYLNVGKEDGNGGTIVDSGSTFMFMEKAVHELVADEIEKQMVAKNFSLAKDIERLTGLRPCFNASVGKAADVPSLTFLFKSRARMVLPLENYFVGTDSGAACLTLVSNGGTSSGNDDVVGPAIILGSFQVQNFYAEYDLEHNKFGFKKQKCA